MKLILLSIGIGIGYSCFSQPLPKFSEYPQPLPEIIRKFKVNHVTAIIPFSSYNIIDTVEFYYDSSGMDSSMYINNERNSYKKYYYDDKKRIKNIEVFSLSVGEFKLFEEYKYLYNADGSYRIAYLHKLWHFSDTSYFNKGGLILKIDYLSERITYVYENKKLVSQKTSRGLPALSKIVWYTYNPNGTLKFQSNVNGTRMVYHYDNSGKLDEVLYDSKNYNPFCQCLQWKTYKTIQYKYN